MPPQNLAFNAKALTNIAEIDISSTIAKQFRDYMTSLPYKQYGEIRTSLCEHMDWSYWTYQRKLHGNTFITIKDRQKIEEFFNEKIFE